MSGQTKLTKGTAVMSSDCEGARNVVKTRRGLRARAGAQAGDGSTLRDDPAQRKPKLLSEIPVLEDAPSGPHSSKKQREGEMITDNGESMGSTPPALLQEDILEKILSLLSQGTEKWDHALVSKDWLRVAQQAQAVLHVREDARLGEQDLLSALGRLPNVRALHLHRFSMKSITEGFIRRLPVSCPHLQELMMGDEAFQRSYYLSPGQLGDLCTGLPGLTALNFSGLECCEMPKALFQLQGMRRLELGLSSDDHEPVFPQEILELSALEHLGMQGWTLPDIPHGITTLKALRSLSLFCLDLTLPESFAAFSRQLTALELGVPDHVPHHMLDDIVLPDLPSWLGSFTCLLSLGLRLDDVKVLPECLWELTQLEKLELHCNATALSPAIGNLQQLKSLTLGASKELLHLPASMARLSGLTELCAYRGLCLCLDSALPSFPALQKVLLNVMKTPWWHAPVMNPEPQMFLPRPQTSPPWCLCGTSRASSTGPQRITGTAQSARGLGNSLAHGSGLTGNGVTTSGSGKSRGSYAKKGRADLQVPGSPAQLSLLDSLEELSLSYARNLPKNLGVLRNLKDIRLFFCSFTKVPASLCSLTALESLLILDSQVAQLPSSLGHLQSLRKLSLSDMPRLIRLPRSFTGLTGLRDLHLFSMSNLAGFDGKLSNLPSLKVLSISACFKIKLVEEVCAFPVSVQCLSLGGMEWEGGGIVGGEGDPMRHLVNLRMLELESISGMTSLPESLGAKSRLDIIRLMGLRDLQNIDCISTLTSLEFLQLCRCERLRFISPSLLELPGLAECSKRMLRGQMEVAQGSYNLRRLPGRMDRGALFPQPESVVTFYSDDSDEDIDSVESESDDE